VLQGKDPVGKDEPGPWANSRTGRDRMESPGTPVSPSRGVADPESGAGTSEPESLRREGSAQSERSAGGWDARGAGPQASVRKDGRGPQEDAIEQEVSSPQAGRST